jgi:hypothetical protein
MAAPWAMRGQAIVSWRGRALVIAERIDASPAGPFISLGFARITRVGLRPGIRYVAAVVDNHDWLATSRRNWGFPGEVGTLSWAVVGDESVVMWHERGLEVRAKVRGNRVPWLVPGRFLQHRADGPVVVPTRTRGHARRADVDVTVPEGDELGSYAGSQRGLVVNGLAVQLRTARRPAGHLWSSRAPAAAPETASFRRG